MENSNFEVALTKELCLICGKEMDGALIMNSILTEKHANEVKKLHNKVVGYSDKYCDECTANMKKAFMIIGYDEDKSDLDNLPGGFYRSGHIVGVKKDIPLVREFIEESTPGAISKGYCFMPWQVMQQLNLINQ